MSRADGNDGIELRRETLETQVYRHLRDRILSGALAAGTRLVQAELATRLGTSRIPVRDALRRLEADALVHVGDTRGTYFVATIDQDDIALVYEIRARLESLAAARAALRMSDDERREVTDLLERMEAAASAGETARYFELDRALHLAVYAGSGSRRLERAIRSLWSGVPPLSPVLVKNHVPAGHEAHRALVDAIRRRDAAAAEAAAAAHVHAVGAALIDELRREAAHPAAGPARARHRQAADEQTP